MVMCCEFFCKDRILYKSVNVGLCERNRLSEGMISMMDFINKAAREDHFRTESIYTTEPLIREPESWDIGL